MADQFVVYFWKAILARSRMSAEEYAALNAVNSVWGVAAK